MKRRAKRDSNSGKEELTPPVTQDLVSMLGGNRLRVSNPAVLEIRERGALFYNTALFLAKLILLAVACIPDIIDTEIGNDEGHNKPRWPLILIRMMLRDVKNTVTIRQGHACHVPEDEHETELLVVHIPILGSACHAHHSRVSR